MYRYIDTCIYICRDIDRPRGSNSTTSYEQHGLDGTGE